MRFDVQASGLQIAFFTFAVAILSVPTTSWVVDALRLEWDKGTATRLFSLLFGAALIAVFTATRKRALAYLGRPIAARHRSEVMVVALAKVISGFAIAGSMVVWRFINTGSTDVGGRPRDQELAYAFSENGLLFLASAVIVAPVVEEVVFRGFLFDAWQRKWGWKRSAILTSTVFGLYHSHFLSAFVSSVIFICVLRRTGSLRAPIVLHCLFNLALWYPLLGQYVFPPADPATTLGKWAFHIAALAVFAVLLPIYVWLADKKPAAVSLHSENPLSA